MYNVKIIEDSISPNGPRITTFEITIPRIVLAEYNTHRQLSRNSASSRAIPVAKRRAQVLEHPFMPLTWGTNQKGMQSGEPLKGEDIDKAKRVWLWARDCMDAAAEKLSDPNGLNVHKGIANRLLEPFMWQTIVATATNWENYFALRCHPDAQEEIQYPSHLMLQAYKDSKPVFRKPGEWHLPYVSAEERGTITVEELLKLSAGRCARVSVLAQDGTRDHADDIKLHNRLMGNTPPHASPTEHQAQCMEKPEHSGNFFGWMQYRKTFKNECTTLLTTRVNPFSSDSVRKSLEAPCKDTKAETICQLSTHINDTQADSVHAPVETPTINDMVNHPKHYNHGKYEPIDVIEDWKLGFNLGNSVKYISRAEHKGTNMVDLKKALWYLEREIRSLEVAENDTKTPEPRC